jgi:hypothetical protein
MQCFLIADRVRRALPATTGALITALTLAIATPGQAQTPPPHKTAVQCPQICIALYAPVRCKMSDGSVRTFSNRCRANIFACEHRLRIIGCQRVLQ